MSDNLFELIHSLTPSEKRYFRINVSMMARKETPKYLVLFDAVLLQKEYDQQVLIEEFRRKGYGNRFSADKNYLYHLILKIMRNYEAERDVYIRIKGLLMDAIFLYHKALYQQSIKLIKRAKKLAGEFEDFPVMLEILSWEKKLLKLLPGGNKKALMGLIQVEEEKFLSLLSNQYVYVYVNLYNHLYMTAREEFTLREKKQRFRIESINNNPLLSDPDQARSFNARHYFLQIKAFIYQLQGQYEESLQYYQQLISHWRKNQIRCNQEQRRFKIILSNYLAHCLKLGRFDEFPDLILEIKRMPSATSHEGLQTRHSMYLFQLIYYLNSGGFNEGLTLAKEIESWLVKHHENIPQSRLMRLQANLLSLYFLSGNFSTALKWCNKILSHSMKGDGKDILHIARILQLFIHIELGNEDILDNYLRAATRNFKGQNRDFSFEVMVLQWVRGYLRLREKERPAAWHALDAKLQEYARGKEGGLTNPGLEIRAWLVSKIKNQPIAEVARAGSNNS